MAERPRVLLVGPFPPTVGGVTTFLRNLMTSPLAEEFEFVPFTTSRPPKRNVIDNWGYAAILRGGIGRMIAGGVVTIWHLVTFPIIVVVKRIDLIQVQASDYLAFWESAAYVLAARALHRPVLLRIGGSFDVFYGASSSSMKRTIARVFSWPNIVIAQSNFALRYFATIGRVSNVVILPNWVNVGSFGEDNRRGATAARCLFIGGPEARHKGIDEVIQAIQRTKAAGIPVTFRLVAMPDLLVERIRDLGLDDVVETNGTLSHAEIIEAMQHAHIFILASHGEGFPNSLIEAMASGMAAIVTPVGAVPEIVAGSGAIVVPVGDAVALADAIARLATDSALMLHIGEQARHLVGQRFTAEIALPPLAAAYRCLLPGKPALDKVGE